MPWTSSRATPRTSARTWCVSGHHYALVIATGLTPGSTTPYQVTLDGEPVKLTAQEYKLLSYLMHHKGKVVSRTELIEHIYDQDFDRDSNTIEVFVTRIRKKLGLTAEENLGAFLARVR